MNIQCVQCETEYEVGTCKNGKPKLPRGWKQEELDLYCGKCFRAKFPGRQKVMSFPCRLPEDRGENDLIVSVLRASNKYYNALIALELEKRKRRRLLYADSPEIAVAKSAVDGTIDEIKAIRQSIKESSIKERRRAGTDETRERIAGLRNRLKVEKLNLKTTKADYLKTRKDSTDKIEAWHNSVMTSARDACGLHWHQYHHVEAAAKAARKSKTDPRFKRFDASGVIAVHFQPAMSTQRMLQGRAAGYFSLNAPERDALPKTFNIALGDGEQRGMITCRVHASQPIPQDAEISWAMLVIDRIGATRHARLNLTLHRKSGWAKGDEAQTGKVAVEVGWRKIGKRLRVSVWRGDDGRTGELFLPGLILERFDKCREIRGLRDSLFNDVMQMMARWMKAREGTLPGWFTEATSAMHLWKSHRRLAMLVGKWRANRFDSDRKPVGPLGEQAIDLHYRGRNGVIEASATMPMFDFMELWRKQDRHLWNWEAHSRVGAVRQRKQVYELFVAEMRRKYRNVVIEDLDVAGLRENAKPEDAESREIAHRYANQAAVATLTTKLKANLRAESVPAKNTTRKHHGCGAMAKGSTRKLMLTCPEGHKFDQDLNAADNIMAASAAVV